MPRPGCHCGGRDDGGHREARVPSDSRHGIGQSLDRGRHHGPRSSGGRPSSSSSSSSSSCPHDDVDGDDDDDDGHIGH